MSDVYHTNAEKGPLLCNRSTRKATVATALADEFAMLTVPTFCRECQQPVEGVGRMVAYGGRTQKFVHLQSAEDIE